MTTLEKIRENCNRINEIASELSYIKHREIQELLCEICKYAEQEPTTRQTGTILPKGHVDDVLDKMKDEIDLETRIDVQHYTNTNIVINAILDVIDKYKAERR